MSETPSVSPLLHAFSKQALRDLFAAVALHGIISERAIERNKSGSLNRRDLVGVANEAWEIADAMMETKK